MNDYFSLEIFFLIWIFLVGLCIGSFLNVVVLRGLWGESIVFPPSKCPKCGNRLKWWMNIPVLSYLMLRGKCHYCREKISIQYPIVEFITGVFFLFIFLKFGFSCETAFYLIGYSILTVMAVTDIKESVIFDFHAYILILAGLILNSLVFGLNGFIFAFLGAISGFIIYEIIARSAYIFIGSRAFGEGDSLIAAGIGAFFGWKMLLVSIILSVFVMAIFTYPYLLIKSYKEKKKKTVFALVLAVFLILCAFVLSKLELEFGFSLLFVFLIMALTIFCAKCILDDIKEKRTDENGYSFLALPFGPAMAISFVLIMFFREELKALIQAYFA